MNKPAHNDTVRKDSTILRIAYALLGSVSSVFLVYAVDRTLYTMGSSFYMFPIGSPDGKFVEALVLLVFVIPAVLVSRNNFKRALKAGAIASAAPIIIFLSVVLITGNDLQMLDVVRIVIYCPLVVMGAVLIAFGAGWFAKQLLEREL